MSDQCLTVYHSFLSGGVSPAGKSCDKTRNLRGGGQFSVSPSTTKYTFAQTYDNLSFNR